MIVNKQIVPMFLIVLIMLGLLITLGVLAYIVVATIIAFIFHKKSDEILEKHINERTDKVMSYLLKIAFLLEMIAGLIVLFLLQW